METITRQRATETTGRLADVILDWTDPDELDITGVAIAPKPSVENHDDRTGVATDLVLYLPLSTDNPQDSKPYRGKETGTLVVLRRDILASVFPDPRFVGWGQEDLAWSLALRTLHGPPWRGTDDLVHLWHPAQPRMNRVVGTPQNLDLYRRYQRANRNRGRMAALLEEVA